MGADKGYIMQVEKRLNDLREEFEAFKEKSEAVIDNFFEEKSINCDWRKGPICGRLIKQANECNLENCPDIDWP